MSPARAARALALPLGLAAALALAACGEEEEAAGGGTPPLPPVSAAPETGTAPGIDGPNPPEPTGTDPAVTGELGDAPPPEADARIGVLDR